MTLFVNQNKKTLYFTAFNTAVETFLTYLENMIQSQFKLGEHQAKCRALYSIHPLSIPAYQRVS